jgi:hypothetical protein
MQTFTSNSASSEVTPVVAALNFAPVLRLRGGLRSGGVAVLQDQPRAEVELPVEWEDTAPSRCSPLDDF